MAEILSCLELGFAIVDLGFKIYEIAKDVKEGYQRQSQSIQALMQAMDKPLKVLCQQLSNYTDDPQKVDPAGVRPVLEEIQHVYTLVHGLIDKVSTKRVKLHKWKKYARDFECFEKLLLGLKKRLNDSIQTHLYLKSNEMIGALSEMDKKFDDFSSMFKKHREDVLSDLENLKNLIEEKAEDQREHIDEAKEDLQDVIEAGFHHAGEEQKKLEGQIQTLSRQLSAFTVVTTETSVGVPLVKSGDVSEKEELCKGTYGTIWKAKIDFEDVLIKDINEISNHDVLENFAKESRNLVKFTSDYIVRLKGICNEPDRKFLVLEFMDKGDLSQVLHESDEDLTPHLRLQMAICAAKAMYRLHVTQMLHENIRSEKFLVNRNFVVKLADLRFAKTFTSAKRYKAKKKPTVEGYHYVSPEQRREPVRNSEITEIYSFGVVLWEIISRTKPFSSIGLDPSDEEVNEFHEQKRHENLPKGLFPPDLTYDLDVLIKQCRSYEPDQRPKAIDVLSKLDKLAQQY